MDTKNDEAPQPVPPHLMHEGKVNYLVKNDSGQWWVITRKDGQPYSGMSLDQFIDQSK